MNKVIKVCVPQKVKVRKYDVNIDMLKTVLRQHKAESGYSNKFIATFLDKPVTLVEHWFRNDRCFAIPDADIWFELKELLCITTKVFDLAITEFEYRDGVFDMSERIYLPNGIAPTITCGQEIRIIERDNI